MSFQSIITQQLATLTERLNAIAINAKKIVELPWQSVLRPSSEIHISDAGKSYKIKIQQIFDWFYSQRQNQLLSVSISVEANDIKVDSGAQWIIDNINYSTLNNTTIHIPYAEDGYTRNDILIANKNNQITRILGTETVGISPTPPTPTGTVLVTIVNVTDATIGYVPPIIGGDYEKVINKVTDFSIVNDVLYPTIKASKTYTDNVASNKLDKNNTTTPNPQTYVKKADGTQVMYSIEGVLNSSANALTNSLGIKNYVDDSLLFKENKANKAIDFNEVNDDLYPTIKASKTYTDNVASNKLDKNNTTTSNPQAYVKKGDGTQVMYSVEGVLNSSANVLTNSLGIKNYVDDSLLFKENKANKAIDFNEVNDDLYPSSKLVKTNLDSINSVIGNLSDYLQLKEDKDEKGVRNGYAGLDANGKVPLSQINDALIGNVKYSGFYNGEVISSSPDGNLNGLTLPSPSTLNRGWYFIANASFTYGTLDYALGDWIISNGISWDRVDNTDAVSTVFGRVGHVAAQSGDYNTGLVTEVANKNYQTNNQKLFNDATSSIQTQLNSKQANLGFTPEPAFGKNTAFNKNFGFVAGTVAEGSDQRILNGQIAFGWGNHASAGYALSNGSNASGNWGINITGNSASATKWLTPIALTIGNTNKPVDGSASVSWSLAEIGAQPLLTNPITGTGTGNRLSKFTGTGTVLGDSNISDNGSNVTMMSPLQLDSVGGGNVSFRNGGTPFGLFASTKNIGGSGSETDLNAYVYGNNPFGIWTNGVKRFTVAGNGSATIEGGAGSDVLNLIKSTGASLSLSGSTGATQSVKLIADNTSNPDFLAYVGGTERLRIQATTGNVGIGTSPLSGGGASKWLTIDGTTTYGGGLISSLNGVAKAYYYFDSGYAVVNGVTGVGVKLQANGADALTVLTNGNVVSIGSVTAPTFNGALNGTANRATTSDSLIDYVGGNRIFWGWNGVLANFRVNNVDFGNTLPMNVSGNATSATNTSNWQGLPRTAGNIVTAGYVMTMNNDGSNAGYTTPAQLSTTMGLNTGATFSNSITGNAGTATNWGGQTANLSTSVSIVVNLVAQQPGGSVAVAELGQVRNWLGLGSNAYSSTAYLPLTGGTISGALGVTNFISTPNVIAPLITLQGGGSPYIQFNTDAGVRRGYIQHNGTSLAISADVGNINLSNNTTVTGTITASGGFFNSDERLKDVLKRDGDVAYFKWKDERDKKTHIGYIAQEVKKTNPDQVIKGEDGILSVNYIEILVEKILKMEKEIEALKGGKHGIC